ncbi:MAG: HAD-IB family phosphatase [Candidatus Pacearchaeota archaeon]
MKPCLKSLENLEKKVVAIFDGDGTLWRFDGEFGSSWDIPKQVLSDKEREIWERRSKIFHSKFEERANFYEYFLKAQIKLLNGKEEIKNFSIPYIEGAKEIVNFFKEKGVEVFLISAGFYSVIKKAAEELKIKFISNEIEIKNGIYTKNTNSYVTPFNKNEIIKKLVNNTTFLILFFDIYDFSIINNNFNNENIKILIYNDSSSGEKEKAFSLYKEKKCDFIASNFFQAIKVIKDKI